MDLRGFQTPELAARASADDRHVLLTLEGSADPRFVRPLGELLGRVHDAIVEGLAREVVVDLRGVDAMSAPCFKTFVAWIVHVQGLGRAARYRIRFVSDGTKPWQRRNLGALSCFAVDLVRVESPPVA
jgi:hypothetical protein